MDNAGNEGVVGNAWTLSVLNSSIAEPGVAKSQRKELPIPYFEIGKERMTRMTRIKKIRSSIFAPDSGLNLGFLGITSRPGSGQNI